MFYGPSERKAKYCPPTSSCNNHFAPRMRLEDRRSSKCKSGHVFLLILHMRYIAKSRVQRKESGKGKKNKQIYGLKLNTSILG